MAEIDVVVVGAGLAGLQCARTLAEAGRSVRVLEARTRVGGRTFSRKIGHATFDLGGQWLGPTQDRAAALVREFGLAMFPSHHHGKKILISRGKQSTYDGTIPRLPLPALVDLQRVIWQVEWMKRRVPVADPMRAAKAAEMDNRTFADWQSRWMLSSQAREVFDVALRVIFGVEATDVSLLHFLFYARSAGNLMRLVEIENGAQETRFVDGAQGLSEGLAARIAKAGGRLTLGTPVRAIAHDADGVTVQAEGEGDVRARHVVVAIPPALTAKIAFTPELPAARRAMIAKYPMGATTKCFALYERAFWRDRGFSGEAVFTDGAVSVVFDNTSHDGRQPCLLAFVVGNAGHDWARRGSELRRDLILSTFAKLFGDDARSPIDYIEQDWTQEEFTGGCPVGVAQPGAWSHGTSALRGPVGRVHWAGTETAEEWNGYMEGALESGVRAAQEILVFPR